MMKFKTLLMCTTLSIVLPQLGYSQSSPNTITDNDIFNLSLEELMNTVVEIAGANKKTLRETPGIITIITEDEIKKSGARDIIDVLRNVPGLDFAGDIENTLSLGVRGHYAMEGKVLFLQDGIEMNETGYGTIPLGNRFLIDNIKKIEIIRGPGSAVYGGMAELAVINIITKSGDDLDGGYASSSIGVSNGATSRYNVQYGIGKKLNNGLELSLTGVYSIANRSNESIDFATNYLDEENGEPITQGFADSSQVKNINFNLGLKYKGLKVRGIFEDHSIEYNYNSADWLLFGGYYVGAQYDYEVSSKLTITPKVFYKKMNPWTYRGNFSGDTYYYLNKNYRSNANITSLYKASGKITITAGVENTSDWAVQPNDSLVFANDENRVSYNNIAAFGEASIMSKYGNFTIGGRLDNHSQFGSAFAPRFAYTKVFEKTHIKGLLSRAFKAPVVNNFELNQNIKPEFTNVGELEFGYMINSKMALTANAYYIHIDDPIIYYYDGETADEFYLNVEKVSTIGLELDYKYSHDWGYINVGYSYYLNNDSKVEAYMDELNNNRLNAFSSHKVTLNSAINLSDKLILAPNIIFNSAKTGYYYRDEYWEDYGPGLFDATLIANLSLHYSPIENLNLTVSAFDIFNTRFIAPSAYDSGYYGTPMMGREFTVKAAYNF